MSDERALRAIASDLDALQHEKRRHFVPALALAVVILASAFIIGGIRNDLFDQPPWQLGVQLTLWGLCLLVFPAIGLGLVFPSRTTRIGLAIAGVSLAVLATTGWPFASGSNPAEHGVDGCLAMVTGAGVVLLALGGISGAFVQRTRVTGVYWVSAGLALAAVNMITWVCPATGMRHVLPWHLGGGLLVLILAIAVARLMHRRQRLAQSP